MIDKQYECLYTFKIVNKNNIINTITQNNDININNNKIYKNNLDTVEILDTENNFLKVLIETPTRSKITKF
jgi:hypothetical protein